MAIRLLSNETIDGTLVITKGITTGSATGGNSGSVTIAGGINQSFRADGSTVTYGSHTNTATATGTTDASAFLISQKNTGGTAIEYRQGVIANGNAFFGKWQSGSITGMGLNVATGNVTFSGTMTVAGGVVMNGNQTVQGNLTVDGTVTGQVNSNTFGTASASGRALIVQSGSSNQAIMLKNNLGGDGTISATGTATSMNYSFGTYSVAPALFIQNDGNVGIGTSTPQTTLEVNGAASALNAHFGQGTNNSSGVFGGISLGYSETGNAGYRKVGIVAKAIGDGAARQELHFLVDTVADGNSAGIADSKMMINTLGNVGIGVSGPVTKLELPGSITNSSLKVGTVETQSYSVNNAWIADNIYYDGSFKLRSNGYASQIYFGTSNGGADISFKRYPTGNAGDVRTAVTSLQLLGNGDVYIPGNVGIGTTTPNYKLSVANASTRIISATYIDGTNGIMSHAGAPNYGLESFQVRGDFISFWTDYDASHYQGTEKMRILANGNVGIGATNVEGRLDVRMNFLSQNWVPDGTSAKWGEVWDSAGTPGTYFDDVMLHVDTNRNGSTTGGVVGIAFSPGWQGHQNWGIYSINTGGGSYTSGDLIFTSQLDNGNIFERVRFKGASGNVGIGTDSPDAKLQVQGNVKGGSASGSAWTDAKDDIGGLDVFVGSGSKALQVWDDNDQTNPRFVVERSGNVGIGLTSPTSKLTVGNGDIELSDSSFTNVPQLKSTGFSGGGRYVTGAIKFDEMNAFNGEIQFWTTPTSSGYANANANHAQRMVINKDGNVGIGTDSPSAKLHIKINTDQNIEFENASNITRFSSLNDARSVNVPIEFAASQFNFITGNVGIGATSPPYKLRLKTDATHTNGIYVSAGSSSANHAFYVENQAGSAEHFAIRGNGQIRINASRSGNIIFGGSSVSGVIGASGSPTGSAFGMESSGRSTLFQGTTSTSAMTMQAYYNPNGQVGRINTTGTTTQFLGSSDYRLKEDLQDFAGLDMISKIPVYDFKWKTDESRSYGVMAHELQEVLPDAVAGEKDDVNEDKSINPQGVDYSKIVPILVKAIQELKAEIETLKKK